MTISARLRTCALGLAAAAVLTTAPMAHADFVPSGYAAGSQQFGLSIGGSPGAGGFQGSWNGTPVVFWCIELTQYFSFGTHYTTQYTASAASNTLLSKLFSEAYGMALMDATHSAAFQLAIWEIIYDSGDLHLNSGSFRVTNNYGHPGTVTLAQTWLDGLSGASANYALYFLTSPDHQDFVTASRIPGVPTTNHVPEPGTLGLVLAALLLAGFTQGRRAASRTR
jgi:hypothetical protein